MGALKNTGGIQTWGVQTYEGIQTYRWASKHMGASKYAGGIITCGVSKHMGDIQTYRGHSCMPFYETKWVSPQVSVNHTVHNILTNEILLILPKFPKVRKEKRGLSDH